MNGHSFLSYLQNHYDFRHANAILSEANIKSCWKHWLTAEIAHLFNHEQGDFQVKTDIYYPSECCTESQGQYLHYLAAKPVEVVDKKRLASRCDLLIKSDQQAHFYELRCAKGESMFKNADFAKFTADIERCEALKAANPRLQITVLLAFYGTFSGKQIESFIPVDNSIRCTYLLDSAIQGSCAISRLTQMQREGEPRLCIAACSV